MKNDGSSGEAGHQRDATRGSNCEGNGSPSIGSRARENLHAANHLSNLFSANSAPDFFSVNAEGKVVARASGKFDTIEDSKRLEKLPSGDIYVEDRKTSFSPDSRTTRKTDQKGSRHHYDNEWKCRMANDTKVESICYSNNVDQKQAASSGAGCSGEGHEEAKVVDSQTPCGSPGMRSDAKRSLLKFGRRNRSTGVLIQKSIFSSSSDEQPYDNVRCVEDCKDPMDQLGSYSECADRNENDDNGNKPTESSEIQEATMLSSPEDDGDEPYIEEDVKVCDICGDAGQEDLLAVCSRCPDGAEHTYCMREMLESVPEGDWLCEECKYSEEMQAKKRDDLKISSINERCKSFGRSSSLILDPSMKLESKDAYFDGNKTKNISLNKQLPNKRLRDDLDVAPTMKKQALESSLDSPTTSSPNQTTVFSKGSSFKNLDKIKVKTSHQMASGSTFIDDTSDTPVSPTSNSPRALKGNFAANSKPRVKVVDEVSQKQNLGIDVKGGPGKMVGKSMSFKGLGRSNSTEPKVKMLSPKFSSFPESRGLKQTKDRNAFDRKNSTRTDNLLPGQSLGSANSRLAHGDSILTASTSCDYKNSQLDGKSMASPRLTGHSVPRSSDFSASLGEAKRHTSSSTNITASTFVNGTGGSAKPNHAGLKDGPMSSSRPADRSVSSVSAAKSDVPDNQSERPLDNACSRPRQVVNSGGMSGNRRSLSMDVSVARTSKGPVNEENKLKAAIEAAMQKRQDIFKKNKVPEKSNKLSMSKPDVYSEAVSQEKLAVSNPLGKSSSDEENHGGGAAIRSYASHSCKQTSVNSGKQFQVYPADSVFSTKVEDFNVNVSSNGEPISTISSIPEPESIWRGCFESHTGGKLSDIYGGIQAHLSSFASSEVAELVKKFPQKIVLDEIPRPCAWPLQFQDAGAREDNIALYFFAKDFESYEKSYKVLVENMKKHDIALKGSIDGVELLVFSSNHLPEKSRRWNMLFFMWGVFRARKPNFVDNRTSSVRKIPNGKAISTVGPSDHPCPGAEDLPACTNGYKAASGTEMLASVECYIRPSGNLPNRDTDTKQHLSDPWCLSGRTSLEHQEGRNERHSPDSCVKSCSVMKEHNEEKPKVVVELLPAIQASNRGNQFHEDVKMPDQRSTLDRLVSHSSNAPQVNMQDPEAVDHSGEEMEIDTMENNVKLDNCVKQEEGCEILVKTDNAQVKYEVNLNQEGGHVDALNNCRGQVKLDESLKQEEVIDMEVSGPSNIKDLNSQQASPMRHSSSEMQASSSVTCQKRSWSESNHALDGSHEEGMNKKIKGNETPYGGNPSRHSISLGADFTSHAHDMDTSSLMEDRCCEVDDDKAVPSSSGSAERFFFPVDLNCEGLGRQFHNPTRDNSVPGRNALAEEDQLPPNLELALGVEKQQQRRVMLPFLTGVVDRSDQDRPPDIPMLKEDGEDGSASLSLSLAFPFTDKDQQARPGRDIKEVVPDNRVDLNTSLLLFREFFDN